MGEFGCNTMTAPSCGLGRLVLPARSCLFAHKDSVRDGECKTSIHVAGAAFVRDSLL